MSTTQKPLSYNSEDAKEILRLLTEDGLTPNKVAKKLGFRTCQVKSLQRYAMRYALKSKNPEWIGELKEKAIESQFRGLDNEDSYKAAQVGERVLKGIGVFRTPDEGRGLQPGNTNIFLMGMTPEQADRVIELAERAANGQRASHRALNSGAAEDSGADQRRSVVVDAQCDQNTEPEMAGTGL